MTYQLKNEAGHIEVYDANNQFLFSADSESEAVRDLKLLYA